MCGICGFIHKQEMDQRILKKMNDTIAYRGPDDEGYYLHTSYSGYQIGFAQKRLSILDLSPLGHQPMHSADQQITIVLNGEIYNFQEIKAQLQDLGYTFRSTSDTEVLIYAYLAWGIDFIQRLNGMFAIALFDKRTNETFLIRDRIGIKPLYYYHTPHTLVFASELKPIIAYPEFQKQIDQASLNVYLAQQYIPAPNTIFENVSKLTPGTYLRFAEGELTQHTYWDLAQKFQQRQVQDLTENQWLDLLDQKITQSVNYRMISDVPLGGFLSGGIDSSLVVALMQKNATSPIKSFTIGFEEEQYNEAPYAKQVADYLGTDHHQVYLSVNQAKQFIEDIPEYYDEPFADNSQLATMLVSQIARQHVTVSLSGDGGDELFCGYKLYDYMTLFNKYRLASKLLRLGNHILPLKSLASKIVNPWTARIPFHIQSPQAIVNYNYAIFQDLYGNLTKTQTPFHPKFTQYLNISPNIQEKRMIQDMLTYLPDDILTKVDRASMSVSLEARTPLLDHNIVEASFAIPHYLKNNNGNKKYILKQLLYRYLPQEIMDRPKKGFSVPVYQWIAEDYAKYTKNYFDVAYLTRQDIFQPQAVQDLVTSFQNKRTRHNSKTLWTLLVFQMWYQRYID